MEKKIGKAKKGEIKKTIIKALKERPESLKELYKLGNRKTIWWNLKKLKDDGDIEPIWDEGIPKYILVDKAQQNVADSGEVNLAIEYLKKGSKKQKYSAIEDLRSLSRERKIMGHKSIESLLKLFKKTSDISLREGLSTVIKWNLQHYYRDRNHEDITMIETFGRRISNLFISVAEDSSENPKTREIALEVLILMGEEGRYEIAFKILEEEIEDNKYKGVSEMVQNIIINQARMKKLEVRKRLYELLTNENESVQNRALLLLDKTGLIGSKPNNY